MAMTSRRLETDGNEWETRPAGLTMRAVEFYSTARDAYATAGWRFRRLAGDFGNVPSICRRLETDGNEWETRGAGLMI
ncbi:MAG: hypothetical protein H5T64_06980 [Chloroflexi bacterium]|nr:hypothetical protein [Chloroflexota bacterium]